MVPLNVLNSTCKQHGKQNGSSLVTWISRAANQNPRFVTIRTLYSIQEVRPTAAMRTMKPRWGWNCLAQRRRSQFRSSIAPFSTPPASGKEDQPLASSVRLSPRYAASLTRFAQGLHCCQLSWTSEVRLRPPRVEA